MDGKKHIYLEFLLLIPIGILLFYYLQLVILVPMVWISIYFGAKLSDYDQVSKKLKHRNIFYHSLFFPLLFIAMSWMSSIFMLFLMILNAGVGIHLLGDIRFKKEARVGFYCVKYPWFNFRRMRWEIRTMSGKNTTRWLLSNFIISLALLVVYARWVF